MEGFLHRSLYLQSIFCRCNVFFPDIWKVASYIWSLKCDIYDRIFSRLCYMMITVLLLGPPTRFWSCRSQKSFGYLGEWHNSEFIKYDFGKNGVHDPLVLPQPLCPGPCYCTIFYWLVKLVSLKKEDMTRTLHTYTKKKSYISEISTKLKTK